MTPLKTSQYGPGHGASHVKHHEWRNAANSAGHLLPHLGRIAGQTPQLKLLDVGAGSGTISASLAQHIPLGQVTATDISSSILQQAAAHATSSGVSNIVFQEASATALPFEDASFDVAHAHQVLCHLSEPHRAISEMLRVVKPGGIVALRECDMQMWCMYPETEGLTDFRRLMAKTMVANGGHEDAGRRLVAWATEAGIPRDNIEASFGTWCFSDPADRKVWANSMVERLRAGPSREQALEYKLATVSSITLMIDAWETWAATQDATLGIMNGICAGKKTVAQYLIDHHGFERLHLQLADSVSAPDVLDSKESVTRRPRPEHSFAAPEDLVDFVTKQWQTRFVTTDISSEVVLDVFARRPFFMLVSVDAPLTVRWQRFQRRQQQQQQQQPGDATIVGGKLTLEEFVTRNDTHLYDHRTSVQHLISRGTVRLLNTSSSLADLYAHLGKLDMTNPDRLRPGWDTYFMALASLASQRSNCMKRRVGCVLVGRERRVISTGYNGTPRGLRNCAEGGCPRCNDGSGSGVGLSTCLCIHAEENALLESGRGRIGDGSVLYCDTCPCLTCSIKICQVGISEVVYANGYSMDTETAAVFSQAGVRLRQFIPPPNGLIHLEKLDLH